jgi:hypothetical protein
MASVAKAEVVEDIARFLDLTKYKALKEHGLWKGVSWPSTLATKMVDTLVVGCSWYGQRLNLAIRRGGDSADFSIQPKVHSAEVMGPEPLRYWHLRALFAAGLKNCAAALCKAEAQVTDLFLVFAKVQSWSAHPLLGGHILVNSALADDTDVICPPDFQKTVMAKTDDIGGVPTGAAILKALRDSGEIVTFTFVKDALVASKSSATNLAIVEIDPAVLGNKKYTTLKKDLTMAEADEPGWVAVAHELIHSINNKLEPDAAKTRRETAETKGWTSQEEVVTITGFLHGVVGVKRALSETAVLADIHLPLRWSHRRYAEATKPDAEDMPKYYGPAWKDLRFLD